MRDKEEFNRKDPDEKYKFNWLTALNWIIPITIILIGLFVSTQKFAGFMNHDYSVIGKPVMVWAKKYPIYSPLMFILGMIKFAFNDVYSYYFFRAIPPLMLSFCTGIFLFVIANILISAHQKNQHIHGTARWATTRDLKKFGMLQANGVVCGELSSANVDYKVDREKASLTLDLPKNLITRQPHIAPLVCHSGRTNTWMIAPTRAGKGVSTVIPTCLAYGVPRWEKDKKTGKKVVKGRGSMVIFDPKGENWEATAGWRSTFSTCLPFRPLDPNGDTVHYNPIHEIPDNPSEAFSWADMIGEIFFGAQNAKQSGDGATEYFNNTARDIFSAVVMHVRFSRNIPWKNKNLSKVLEIFSLSSRENDDEDEDNSCGKKMLNELRIDRIHVNDKGEEAVEIHRLIVNAANRSETQTPKERASTYSTVFSKISLFQDPLLAEATAYSDFSVDDFIDGKFGISLYLIVPYNHIKRISPVFRMLITFMIKKFSGGTTNANSVKLKIPCLFLLDEFPVLGYFPDIALNAGILAGYGVTFFIVSQSLNQIVDVYGENHPFLDHCKTIILFAPGNIKDAKNFSETIGNRSVLLDNISASGNRWGSGLNNVSRSSQETQTSLISPDELMKLDFSRCIIFNQGMPPYKGKKVVYYQDPRFKDKAFKIPAPDMKTIFEEAKKYFPSRKKKRIEINPVEIKKDGEMTSEERIEYVKSVDVLQIIPDAFDLFSA